MKTTQSIADLLGFTQAELAMVLNVSRSQFSQYELGTRDIPLTAKQLLAEMLQYIQGSELLTKTPPQLEQQQTKKQLQLQRLLKENVYQSLVVARKIEFLEKKYARKIKALQLIEFLSEHRSFKGEMVGSALKSISKKASKALEVEGLGVLIKYQIKQEVLELEKLVLESKLRKLTLPLENKGEDNKL